MGCSTAHEAFVSSGPFIHILIASFHLLLCLPGPWSGPCSQNSGGRWEEYAIQTNNIMCAGKTVQRMGWAGWVPRKQLTLNSYSRDSQELPVRMKGAGLDISTQSRQEAFPMSTSTCTMHPPVLCIHLCHASTCAMHPPAPCIHLHHASTCTMHIPAPFIHLHHSSTCTMHTPAPCLHLHHASICVMHPSVSCIHLFHASTCSMYPPAPCIYLHHESTCSLVKVYYSTNSMVPNPFFSHSLHLSCCQETLCIGVGWCIQEPLSLVQPPLRLCSIPGRS